MEEKKVEELLPLNVYPVTLIANIGYNLEAVVQNLTMSLVNILLKFQMLIPEVCQYFLLKKCEKLL